LFWFLPWWSIPVSFPAGDETGVHQQAQKNTNPLTTNHETSNHTPALKIAAHPIKHESPEPMQIYHNPRCSKSRAALEQAQSFAAEKGEQLDVIEYLTTPPTLADLKKLAAQLDTPLRSLVRENEDEYAQLNLADASDDALLKAIAAHPKLLQRPVLVRNGRAIIGRTPEALDAFLK
jgi:arsenate reductase